MKKLRLALCLMLGVLALNACKKDVGPTLLVTVVDDLNNRIPRAWVEISVDGANNGILVPSAIDSTYTDEFGTATFEYKNTILVDIKLYKNAQSDIVEDSTSVLLETERSIDDDNVIERKLVIRTL